MQEGERNPARHIIYLRSRTRLQARQPTSPLLTSWKYRAFACQLSACGHGPLSNWTRFRKFCSSLSGSTRVPLDNRSPAIHVPARSAFLNESGSGCSSTTHPLTSIKVEHKPLPLHSIARHCVLAYGIVPIECTPIHASTFISASRSFGGQIFPRGESVSSQMPRAFYAVASSSPKNAGSYSQSPLLFPIEPRVFPVSAGTNHLRFFINLFADRISLTNVQDLRRLGTKRSCTAVPVASRESNNSWAFLSQAGIRQRNWP